MRRVTALNGDTTDRNTSDDEEQPPSKIGDQVRHQKDWCLYVLHKVTWPNEVVYTSEGKPASFQDLSIPLFVQGYLIIMESEEGLIKQLMTNHLQDLMSDAQW